MRLRILKTSEYDGVEASGYGFDQDKYKVIETLQISYGFKDWIDVPIEDMTILGKFS